VLGALQRHLAPRRALVTRIVHAARSEVSDTIRGFPGGIALGSRLKWACVGIALGGCLGVGGVAAYELLTRQTLVSAASLRDRMWRFHAQAEARFLDVPRDRVHLRAVPPRSNFLPGRVELGTMATQEDAYHEFHHKETRDWLVVLYEAAVAHPGVLTLELVDRPEPDGTPRTVVARLQQCVEASRSLLLGLGFEGLQGRDYGARVTPPDSRGPLGRIRLLAAGGHAPPSADASVERRIYTSTLTPSAWGPVATTDVALPDEVRTELSGLVHRWIDGPTLDSRHPRVGSVGRVLPLGALFWLPMSSGPGSVTGSHRSWVNGQVDDRLTAGGVTVHRTNDFIALSEGGRDIPIQAYSRPAWVLRLKFDPDGVD
jgi:hypothetical protein